MGLDGIDKIIIPPNPINPSSDKKKADRSPPFEYVAKVLDIILSNYVTVWIYVRDAGGGSLFL